DGESVYFETFQLREAAAFAGRIDTEHFCRSGSRAAAGCVEIAFGIRDEGPKIGDGGIEDFWKFRSEEKAAVASQRDVPERALLEIGTVALLPEMRFDGEAGAGGCDCDK